MMKLLFISLVFGFSILLFNSCHERGPLFPPPALGLGLRDYSCTEAWIEVQVGNNDKTANIYLKKNDEIIQTIRLGQSDSLFYFDDLLPNTSYKFDAVTYDDGTEIKSNPVTFTTLDTTSHNFTWQTFTFGEAGAGGSTLYDVAIINENNIWAVGEIYMNDSLGQPIRYNAMHWDGQSWVLKRIMFYTICGQQSRTSYPAKAIFAFNENEIWIAMDGDQIVKLENGIQVNTICLPWSFSINKLWGTSSIDLYAVGDAGNIAHYQNGNWTKIESGTTTNINDVWGVFENGTNTVYCPVSSVFNPPQDKKILKIISNKVDSIGWSINRIVYSCWTDNKNFLYVCGEGVFVNKFGYWNEIVLQPVGTNSIRGNGVNDIFIDGDYGFITHFNGSTWQIYNNNYLKGYSRLSFKGDIVAVAGNYQGKAIVEIGRRN